MDFVVVSENVEVDTLFVLWIVILGTTAMATDTKLNTHTILTSETIFILENNAKFYICRYTV